jgi:hypothetical protein
MAFYRRWHAKVMMYQVLVPIGEKPGAKNQSNVHWKKLNH